ncbi:MAG: carboxypeptidase regulatory-like domain-containing protein, partial [Ignavibacteriales bacterium]|nr:carboxypeptidase regulatory-like domain-containing protein [Ignavibacteriales bacterium]
MNETSRYIIILLIISIYCSGCNTTQPESENDSPGSVEGRISDIARDTLIAGAAITTNPFTIRVITDSSGYYKITGISRGLYKIIASKTYYNSDSLTVSIEAGKTSVADIKLKQQINNAPNPPEVITPEDSSTGIGTTLTLSWTCTDPDGDSLFFDVYFGKSNPPATIISQNQSRTTYTKSGLDSQSVYYWKVVAKDTRNGVTPGNNWRFTTALKTLPTQGLVAYYPFNGNANDESGNGNNGTVYGAAMTKDRFGNANKAYSFDGVNDYIKASSNSLPTGARTISVWFFASSLLTHPVVLGYGGG